MAKWSLTKPASHSRILSQHRSKKFDAASSVKSPQREKYNSYSSEQHAKYTAENDHMSSSRHS